MSAHFPFIFTVAALTLVPACEPPPPAPAPLVISGRRAAAPSTRASAAAVMAPAAALPRRPAPQPSAELRNERAALAGAFDELDLYCREVQAMELPDADRAKVAGALGEAKSAWDRLRPLMDSGAAPPQEERAQAAQSFERARQNVQAILGPDRILQLATLHRSPRGGGTRFAARLEQALERQQLTPDQTARIASAMGDTHRRINQLPEEESGDEASTRAIRQQMRDLIDQTRADLERILTPRQMDAVRLAVPSLGTARR